MVCVTMLKNNGVEIDRLIWMCAVHTVDTRLFGICCIIAKKNYSVQLLGQKSPDCHVAVPRSYRGRDDHPENWYVENSPKVMANALKIIDDPNCFWMRSKPCCNCP